MENDKASYIVAYSSSEANVRLMLDDINFCNREMLDSFLFGLSRYPDKNRDDIIGWNNQFWGIVDADNAMDALKKFMDKLIEQFSGNTIHPVEGE